MVSERSVSRSSPRRPIFRLQYPGIDKPLTASVGLALVEAFGAATFSRVPNRQVAIKGELRSLAAWGTRRSKPR
jgi:hypothetical protein